MRFAMFSTFYPPHHFGGDAVFTYRLSHALADRGHDVHVYFNEDAYHALAYGKTAQGYAGHPRVKTIPLRAAVGMAELLLMQQTGRPAQHARTLQAAVRDGGYDVLHFHNVSLMGAPALLSWARDARAVSLLTLHDHWMVCPMHVLWRYGREACTEQTCIRCQLQGRRPPQLWRYTPLRDRSVAGLDAVLAPSAFTRDKHRELGLQVEPRLLPHFVPALAEGAAPTRASGRPYFLFAGRLERLKGAHTLIEAFRGFRDADLLIAGDGGERGALEQLAGGLDNVYFLGRLSAGELNGYYRAARAALVPSLCFEVFGLTAVEAFAAGAPAVVRNHGSLPELVEQGGGGVAYSTESELVGILHRLTHDVVYRDELSARARAAYLANWTLERHLKDYFAIIEEVAARKGLPLARARSAEGAAS